MGCKVGLLAVRHDLGVDAAIPLEDADDEGLSRRPAGTLAAHAPGAEVRFIHLDFAALEGRGGLAFLGGALTYSEKDRRDGLASQITQLRRPTGRQVGGKGVAPAEIALANFGALITAF